MRNTTLAGAVLALALILAACGGDTAEQPVAADADGVPAAAAAVPDTIDVKAGTSDLGAVLTGPQGFTLYGFTNDVDAISACYGTCADAWPPVIVDVDFQAGPGLDFGIFATTVREDGRLQLVAGKWPLYYFAGDAAPGGINGQGSGGVWFAAATDGGLITEASQEQGSETTEEQATEAPDQSLVATATTEIGEVLVDAAGLTLYGFLNDSDGAPTCNEACADAWPPLVIDGLPDGLDPAVYSVVARDDGALQLKAGQWPLYYFAGDAARGDINGQGSGDVWFASSADGSLIGAPGGGDQTTSTESDY